MLKEPASSMTSSNETTDGSSKDVSVLAMEIPSVFAKHKPKRR